MGQLHASLSGDRSRSRLAWLALFVGVLSAIAAAKSATLAKTAEYHRYIDPLVDVQDYRVSYFEDGAADASVLFPIDAKPPYSYLQPVNAVAALVRLGNAGVPLLIDCLSDGRITNMRFLGNTITRDMNVPVGYVCLDILMNEVGGKPVSDPECSNDGLGACMNHGFYFRPDDYYLCSGRDCSLRPWVLVVQQTWRRAYLAHHLKVHNPYDSFPAEEYKHLKTEPPK